MKRAVFSARSAVIVALALTGPLLLDLYVRVLKAGGSEAVSLAVSDFGEAAFVALAGAFVVYAAYRFGIAEATGRNWLLIGVAMLMFAVGDVVYGIYEVVLQVESVPYPGWPDVFYLLSYVFFAWAIFSAALSYRKLVDVKMPLVISAAAGVVALGVIYRFVLIPVLAADAAWAEKALNVAYPVLDVLLELAPALFVVLVVRQLGGGKLAWPWLVVAAGVALLALADSGYSYLMAHDAYEAGAIVDMGWAFGYGLIAIGASVARDVFAL
jgi:diguanylate cyclase